MKPDESIFVAGHRGLVGSAIIRALEKRGFQNLVTRTRAELDLRDAAAVDELFRSVKIDHVFLAAARVGGIFANESQPADFIRDNLLLQTAVIDACHRHAVKRLLFLGSSCVYPRLAPQPLKESSILTGELEPTNEAYAIAKIAGIKMCQAYRRQFGSDFRCIMPTNLYGPNDNFDLDSSHVLPALIRKFHEAKLAGSPTVTLWGSGTPRRELMHVDDMADACIFIMEQDDIADIVNVGWGNDISIAELARLVGAAVGYTGEIIFDRSRPDGTPRKLLDTSRLNELGWRPAIPLPEGIDRTYRWYVAQTASEGAQ